MPNPGILTPFLNRLTNPPGGSSSEGTGPIDPARLTNVPASAITGSVDADNLPSRLNPIAPLFLTTAGQHMATNAWLGRPVIYTNAAAGTIPIQSRNFVIGDELSITRQGEGGALVLQLAMSSANPGSPGQVLPTGGSSCTLGDNSTIRIVWDGTNWHCVTDAGPVNAARLPGLRRRYARYDVATPVMINASPGSFTSPTSIIHLTLNGGAASSSVLDRWSNGNHPFNIQGNYLDRSQFIDDEVCSLALEFSSEHSRFTNLDFRIRWVDENNTTLSISDLSLVSTAINTNDTDGTQIDRLFANMVMSDEISDLSARGRIEFVSRVPLGSDRELRLQTISISGGTVYNG